jgi:hypothetical protein
MGFNLAFEGLKSSFLTITGFVSFQTSGSKEAAYTKE